MEDIGASGRLKGLLHHMSQLMGQQPLPDSTPRRVLIGPEHQILPDSERLSLDCACGFVCLRVAMYAHLAEIVTKARLEECARGRDERLPWRTQRLMYYRRSVRRRFRTSPPPPALHFLLFFLLAPITFMCHVESIRREWKP